MARHILSGGFDVKISQWIVPELPKDRVQEIANLDFPSVPSSDHVLDLQLLPSLHQKHIGPPPDTECIIREVIDAQLDDTPLRLLNTFTGRLCDREAQLSTFRESLEYEQLLSLTRPADFRMEHTKKVVGAYFRCVMLSHRWEGKEPLLQDIQEKVVYELNAAGVGIVKLQSFCKIARRAGCRWAWIDSCCIDQNNIAELQRSLNSMFAWYRHSALTIVYLSDVPPSSKSGALARSVWNTRGWTVPEFLAPKVVLFCQQDWSLYLNERHSNHKESDAIMRELEDATGIDAHSLVAFQPGMRDARDKLRWASMRVTTVQEDIAYSLFGIFGVHLPILYGEKKQNALGRLLQEIVARSGDVSTLDWVGKSSEFNSCLPASITSYHDPPCAPSSLSEDEIRTSVSSLQNDILVESAFKLYTLLNNLSSPRFANCRLHLPCITFLVTEVRRRHRQNQETHFTYGVKADGLNDLLIATEDKLVPFSRARPIRQTFLLVRPWNRELLELPDYVDDTNVDDFSVVGSPAPESSRWSHAGDLEAHSRALRLIVHLGQPFGAILLAQQRSGEYKRIASEHDIIAQVKDMASLPNIMDVRTLEIL
ncbi:hypothetical protein EDB19DRAFT_236797 [Suillus lakei]|nr:hypothetical protein EDB19DRAFT_236797 [Suillus lakei]